MSPFKKLLDRFKRLPLDFTYDELRRLLSGLGYKEHHKGKTSGSRVAFVHSETKHIIRLHRPHPSNTLKQYVLEQVHEALSNQGALQ